MWMHFYSDVFSGVNREDVWKIWTDINNWPKWHSDLEYCKLEGAFEVGNHFILKPKRARPVKIMLTEINEGHSFTDETSFFGAKMSDTHDIMDTPYGLRLTNSLVVEGPLEWLWTRLVARHIADSAPDEFAELIKLARG